MSNVTCVYGPQPPGMSRGRCHYGRGTIGVLGSDVPDDGVDGPAIPRAAMTVSGSSRYRVIPIRVPIRISLEIGEDGSCIGTAGIETAFAVQLAIIEDGALL